MADRWERKLPCQDGFGRSRNLTIFVSDDNQVGIFTPPGEAAKVPPNRVQELQQALVAAAIEATHRGVGQ